MSKISTPEVLAARQQLRYAVRELPLAAMTSLPTLTTTAPSLEEIDDRVLPGHPATEVRDIPVTFFRDALDGHPVWRFEGNLSVLDGDVEEARRLGGFNRWAREELGDRCREADVSEPVGTVSVAVIHFA